MGSTSNDWFTVKAAERGLPVQLIDIDTLVKKRLSHKENIIYLAEKSIKKKIVSNYPELSWCTGLVGVEECTIFLLRKDGKVETWMPAQNSERMAYSLRWLTSQECDTKWDCAYIIKECDSINIAELI